MSVSQCKAQTKSGEPCKARPTPDGFCSLHSDPGRAAELGRRSGESRKLPDSEPLVLPPPKTADDLPWGGVGATSPRFSSRRLSCRTNEVRLCGIGRIIRLIENGREGQPLAGLPETPGDLTRSSEEEHAATVGRKCGRWCRIRQVVSRRTTRAVPDHAHQPL
jgi:hypothetical protein